MTGKQNLLTAGNGIGIESSTDTISVDLSTALLTSPNGSTWKITVDDSGNLRTTLVSDSAGDETPFIPQN